MVNNWASKQGMLEKVWEEVLLNTVIMLIIVVICKITMHCIMLHYLCPLPDLSVCEIKVKINTNLPEILGLPMRGDWK